LENIFTKFYQIDKPQGLNKLGCGLGLTISKNLAGALDGELTVKSKKDEGSTFTLILKNRIPHD
jgi:signal transduction histidine kinase